MSFPRARLAGLAVASLIAGSAAADPSVAPEVAADRSAAAEAASLVVSRTAVVKIAITATLATDYAAGTTFTCIGTVGHESIETYAEEDREVGSRSGTTVTCTPVVAFQWPKAESTLSVKIAFTLTATRPDGTSRTVTRALVPIGLPLNGRTVTVKAATRL